MIANGSILSRRNLLVGLAGGAAVGAIATSNAGQEEVQAFKNLLWKNKPGKRYVRLDTATVDDWSLQVGTKFRASSGHTLRLDDVQQFDHQNTRPKGLRDRAFAAGFSIISGVGALPSQVLLQVSHAEGGTFDMFMTAGSPDKPQRRIAVFG
jgi:hypothetical protein